MADEYYNNKLVTTDGDVLMDLTQDTATPETVLEGETFHLRSGAPAVGTYRPSDEIEARLRATVGHSSKNLLKIEADSQTINGVTFTVNKTAGTITVNGQVSSSATMAQLDIVSRRDVDSSLNGLILTEPASKTIPNYGFRTAISYYNSSGTYISEQVTNSGNPNPVKISIPSNAATYKIYIRATTSAGTLNNLVVTPMLREAVISDDTFEPYVTPTDEAKQDKPVELVSTDTNTFIYPSVIELKSKYSMLLVTFANSSRSIFASVWIPTSTIKNNINEQSNYTYVSTLTMLRTAPVSIWDDGVHISSAESDETIISIQVFPK